MDLKACILIHQQELKTCDNLYVKDLKRQGEDVDFMIDGMKEQIKNLMKSDKEEYEKIEVRWTARQLHRAHRHALVVLDKLLVLIVCPNFAAFL